ncbi:hypothetical protein [Loktanella sp. R86503]|uniref:hypothetical protein n=1 Tax=Loktanella sp. R86503 TaxID=3093847 RepID=UPI0036D9691E
MTTWQTDAVNGGWSMVSAKIICALRRIGVLLHIGGLAMALQWRSVAAVLWPMHYGGRGLPRPHQQEAAQCD